MGKEFSFEPVDVPRVQTQHRRIVTKIPVPESLPILEKMRRAEPRSMAGQPPVIWDRCLGICVLDGFGNQWIDFSSGVLVTACGHKHPQIVSAISQQLEEGSYHAYCFPTKCRSELVCKLAELAPEPLKKVFLLTTGSEATECCIKLAMTWGRTNHGPKKKVLVSFEHAFHGRTMGAQLAGGIPSLKDWLGGPDERFVQVPYPEGFRNKDVSFDGFLRSLEKQGVSPDKICGVMSETYPGVDASMWTPEYARRMREWCDANDVLLIFDEVQAGFGRTGKMFGFEHLDIVPDLMALGKGISGGMPLSAVIGRPDVMDQFGPGEMTSTHSANPVCVAAALANIRVIEQENLPGKAASLQEPLRQGLEAAMQVSDGHIGSVNAIGLVGALQFVQPGTTTPDPEMAWQVTNRLIQSGVMVFAPVGVGGGAIKICPPLIIDEDALREGLEVVRDTVQAFC